MVRATFVALVLMMFVHSPAALAEEPILIVSRVLELSEAQTQTLIEMIHARDTAIRPIAEAVQANERALAVLLETPNPDPATAGRLLVEIRDGQRRASMVAEGAAASFAATLSEEQRHRLQFMREAVRVAPALPAFKAVGLL